MGSDGERQMKLLFACLPLASCCVAQVGWGSPAGGTPAVEGVLKNAYLDPMPTYFLTHQLDAGRGPGGWMLPEVGGGH